MIKFFTYDLDKNKIIINEAEIFLVKEFKDLWDEERNKCKLDPTGEKKLRGFKELIYIYMAIDWAAPGSKDTPENRKLYAKEASGLTDTELEDEVFKKACLKYIELQNSSSLVGKLIETYTNNIHKMRVFLETIDYDERKESGEPVFKIKDTLVEIQNLTKALDALRDLEDRYKQEQDAAAGLRGDQEEGNFD